jgi:Zn-dependent protease/CBS domain-containing protein
MVRNWSIPAGRIFGVDIRIHLSFLLLMLFIGITESAVPHGTTVDRAVALTGIIFGAVLLHELGHALAALHSDVQARAVILLPIGGVTLMDETMLQKPDTWRDVRLALAGPLLNLAVGAISGVMLYSVVPEIGLWQKPLLYSGALLRSFVWSNLLLGALNLLPAYPLDGGQVLRAFLTRDMDPVRATHRVVAVGQAFSMFLIFAGIWNNWLMLVGAFLFIAAQMEQRSAVFQSVLVSVQVGEIMLTEFASLSPADTLQDALEKAVHSLQDDFPVIRGSDLVGVISRQGILAALRAGGNGYVQAVMQQVSETGDIRDSLASAFRKITGGGLTLLPVVDGGRLVGILTFQNLMHSMGVIAETRRLRQQAT